MEYLNKIGTNHIITFQRDRRGVYFGKGVQTFLKLDTKKSVDVFYLVDDNKVIQQVAFRFNICKAGRYKLSSQMRIYNSPLHRTIGTLDQKQSFNVEYVKSKSLGLIALINVGFLNIVHQ
jgi:hypothetical protein